MENRIKITKENLEKNNMSCIYVETKEEALVEINKMIKEGDTISVGGSITLDEIGLFPILRCGKYNFLDRYAEITSEELDKLYRDMFSSDVFFSSSNAVTMQGELYNVDGRGTRVAPMIFGPSKVIVVVGVNKIVDDLNGAIERNRKISAPLNTKRLNKKTPCAKTGYCIDCNSEERICREYVLIRKPLKNRITVIIVNEELGF